MNTPHPSTRTLIQVLRALAVDTHSEGGVANAVMAEAADRLEELQNTPAAASIHSRTPGALSSTHKDIDDADELTTRLGFRVSCGPHRQQTS